MYLQSKGKKLSAENKVFIRLQSNVILVSEKIADELSIKDEQKKKFANPFSLAQLYNIIETEKRGFISTTLAAVDENAWRNNLQGRAHCVPLCSDTVRPFDGALRKILDRQAYEIAKLKADELNSSDFLYITKVSSYSMPYPKHFRKLYSFHFHCTLLLP